jgi:chemotaxis protein methyltransferase CheR
MNPLADLPAGFQSVLDLIVDRAGLAFPCSRRGEVCAAIERGMAREGVAEPARFLAVLKSESRAFDELVAELTVGETYFLREPAQFQFVRTTVLPELNRKKPAALPLRIWSAGCATGEEAYSLAIVVAEAGLAARSQILATDISRAALAKAAQAAYREWSFRGAAADVARRWMRRAADRYVVVDDLRRQVTFAYLNLALDVYPSMASGVWGMDLVFCRNVLIYFDQQTVRRVAQRLYDSLAPGGWLITASSDPSLIGLAPWEAIVAEQGVFYRRPDLARLPVEVAVEEQADALQEEKTVVRQVSQAGKPALRAPEARVVFAEIHALANRDAAQAARRCEEAVAGNPLSAELHYLHAVLLEGQGRSAEAAAAARRAIYLDRSLAVAHFTLGASLERQKDWAGARRAYRNAYELCLARPAGEAAPLAENETAGRLAEAAAAHLAILDGAER